MKRIVAVIPSRFASTRLPGKPLILINGISLIERVWKQVRKCRKIDEIIVATDDKRIFYHVTGFGGKAVMTSVGCKSGTDRLCEVARRFEKSAYAFINVQGDEPLISPKLVDTIAEELRAGKTEMATAGFPLKDKELIGNPNVVKVVLDKFKNAVYFSRSPIPYSRQKGKTFVLKHIGIYGYTRNFLLKYSSFSQTPLELSEQLEQLRVIENGYKIKVIISKVDSAGVDTPEDIKRVEKILKNI